MNSDMIKLLEGITRSLKNVYMEINSLDDKNYISIEEKLQDIGESIKKIEIISMIEEVDLEKLKERITKPYEKIKELWDKIKKGTINNER